MGKYGVSAETEKLFAQEYWGKLEPPVERYRTRKASWRDKIRLEHRLGRITVPILKGDITGMKLVKGAPYNPGNPRLTGSVQHTPGTILLVDEEHLYSGPLLDTYPHNDKPLPPEETVVQSLELSPRRFLTEPGQLAACECLQPWRSIAIQKEGVVYHRTVSIHGIARQKNSTTPVAYYTTPMPTYQSDPRVQLFYNQNTSSAERVGLSYDTAAGFSRLIGVEICQEGLPSLVNEKVVDSAAQFSIA